MLSNFSFQKPFVCNSLDVLALFYYHDVLKVRPIIRVNTDLTLSIWGLFSLLILLLYVINVITALPSRFVQPLSQNLKLLDYIRRY